MPTQEECDLMKKELHDTAEELHKHLRSTQKSIDKLDTKLTEHIKDFKIHEDLEKVKYDDYLEAQRVNTIAINHLVEQMQIQSEDTKGLIDTWKTLANIVKGISWVRNIILWVCSTIVGLGGVYMLLHHLGYIK